MSSKVYAYLYIPEYLSDWLKRKAEEERRSFNNYVNLILEDYYRKHREGALCISPP
ncbi:MAG: hypothetical protein H5T33_05260 [Candidatus Methanosuratus sp.]|nr:hypothetical protein [Candidatus Methanosuratincola sp.]MBC7120972.1 hypothetical protein [Candidatus Methanosuratincola sp.]